VTSGKKTSTTAMANITTHFPYALTFNNRGNGFADIQSTEFLLTANLNTSRVKRIILIAAEETKEVE
jgi:hypothetical protein